MKNHRIIGIILTLAILATAILPFGVFADGEEALLDDAGIEAVQTDEGQKASEAVSEDEQLAQENEQPTQDEVIEEDKPKAPEEESQEVAEEAKEAKEAKESPSDEISALSASDLQPNEAAPLDAAELEAALGNASINTIYIKNDITLTKSLDITKNTDFVQVGGNYNIFADGDYRHFTVNGATVDFGNLTLTRSANLVAGELNGGGLAIQGVVTLGHVNVKGNRQADLTGGGITVATSATLNISNSRITENMAISGAGIHTDGGNISVSNGTVISENKATRIAGHSYATTDGAGGGIWASNGAHVTVSGNVEISKNTAEYRGGGIYAWKSCIVEVSNGAKITGNKTISGGSDGGGIYSSWSSVTLSNVEISENQSAYGAGLTFNSNSTYVFDSKLSITNSDIHHNAATYMAGGVYMTAGKLVALENNRIYSNTAYQSGGGLVLSVAANSGFTMSYCEIYDNKTTRTGYNSGSGGGLIISSDDGDVNIEHSKIYNNEAGSGGGISVGSATWADYENKVTLYESEVYGNKAFYSNGGGIEICDDTRFILKHSDVHDNTSKHGGGGIYLRKWYTTRLNLSTRLEVKDGSKIYKNTATTGGGIITNTSIHDYYKVSVVVENSEIFENKATEDNGGGIFALNSDVELKGSTKIYDNEAVLTGGGVAMVTEIDNPNWSSWDDPDYLYLPTYEYLTVGSGVTFSGNKAKRGYFMTSDDKDYAANHALYTANVHATKFSEPFTLGYNNFDINYDVGVPLWYVKFFGGSDDKLFSTKGVKSGTAVIAPTAPSITGYHFTKWDKPLSNITADTEIHAAYEINTYSVKFVDWDNGVLKSESVDYNKAATAPANPSRTGYTFTGWNKAFSSITSNLTVKAQYDLNRYTVNFLDHDGTLLSTQLVGYGSGATAPANPVRDGYTFTGWDNEFANITGDLTITAQYEPLQGTGGGTTNPPTPPTPPTPPNPPRRPEVPTDPDTQNPPTAPEVVNEPREPEASAPVDNVTDSTTNVQKPPLYTGISDAGVEKLEAQTGNIITDLANGNVPLGGFAATGVWSLLNMILAIACAVAAFMLAYGAISKRSYPASSQAIRLIAIASSVITVIVWVILDQLHKPTAWLDGHTPVILGLFALTAAITVVFNIKKRSTKERKPELA
ncbi:MAG: InlB B-repeat-containing protein [Clostridiales Family XIII bacterium]|jgi:uncharacterized repeat protein (TIGR02543 family)|nr:InlB B-repeat-containing protein [Clostridiales Family XIII bacterium]